METNFIEPYTGTIHWTWSWGNYTELDTGQITFNFQRSKKKKYIKPDTGTITMNLSLDWLIYCYLSCSGYLTRTDWIPCTTGIKYLPERPFLLDKRNAVCIFCCGRESSPQLGTILLKAFYIRLSSFSV